jgi:hypothetical protein
LERRHDLPHYRRARGLRAGRHGGPRDEPPGERECFQLASVSGYSHARNNRVYVHAGPSRTYEFRTMGPCPDLGWSEAIALDPATAGPICTGIDVDLIVPSAIGPRRCPISMIRRLEPGERPAR